MRFRNTLSIMLINVALTACTTAQVKPHDPTTYEKGKDIQADVQSRKAEHLETFLDQRKKVPPYREWIREVFSRKEGSFNVRVSSQGAIAVTIVTAKGHEAISRGDKKSFKLFDDLLLSIDSKDGVFEGKVMVPAGSLRIMIENQTDKEAEIHLQCFIPDVWSDRTLMNRMPAKLQEYSPQDLGLSLQLPSDPIKVDMPWSDIVMDNSKERKVYAYNDQHISVVAIKFVSDRLSGGASGLKDMAAGFLDSLSKRPGVSNVVKMIELKDESTLLMRNTFKNWATYMEIRGSVHAKGNSAWIVAITFVLGDEQATELSSKIIDSIKVE